MRILRGLHKLSCQSSVLSLHVNEAPFARADVPDSEQRGTASPQIAYLPRMLYIR